uniref:ZF-HD dimerization-type domain-containing protein n=1 Tax=Araucaria cunninghamii TaxID=56994 RepID=A0A0D6R4L7_ARACU
MDPRISEAQPVQQEIIGRNTLQNHNYSNEEEDNDDNDFRDRMLRENGVAGLNGNDNGSEAGGSGRRTVRYRECLKNHAANMGSHALDGCGEFMPGGAEGTAEALKCQACGCHRNFHRREAEGERSPPYVRTSSVTALPYNPPPQVMYGAQRHPAVAAAVPVRFGGEESEHVAAALAALARGGNGGGGGGRKRFRTKFTAEQKAKMGEFAERVGWRIQKQDEADVERFCADVGVRRNVLKVWMHNNKNTLAKKSS